MSQRRGMAGLLLPLALIAAWSTRGFCSKMRALVICAECHLNLLPELPGLNRQWGPIAFSSDR